MTLKIVLHHASDPGRRVDQRVLDEGDLRVGRDPGEGWSIDDPDRAVSRTHFCVHVRDGRASIRDLSSNGVFLTDPLRRLARDEATALRIGDGFTFGRFHAVLESAAPSEPLAATDEADDSPFGPSAAGSPFGRDAPGFRDAGRSADPFASELAADPLAAPAPDDDMGLGPLAPLGGGQDRSSAGSRPARAAAGMDGEDAWERRDARRAGGWNAPARGAPDGHEHLIGSGRSWSTPPPEPPPEVGFGFDAPFTRPMMKAVAVDRSDLQIPSDWDEPAVPERPAVTADSAAPAAMASLPPSAPMAETPVVVQVMARSDAEFRLLAAFCAGAKLDPQAFVGEDPAQVMERLGAVYRQLVLGLGDLLGDRTTVKNEYRMNRTTVAKEGNNPFKWAPPQRVAVDLLRAEGDGFLNGPAAATASFQDLKKHLLCMLAGLRASLASTLEALSPETTDAELADRRFLLKSSREAAAWAEYRKRYARFRREADDNPDSRINREFRAAYERQLQTLDGLGGGEGG